MGCLLDPHDYAGIIHDASPRVRPAVPSRDKLLPPTSVNKKPKVYAPTISPVGTPSSTIVKPTNSSDEFSSDDENKLIIDDSATLVTVSVPDCEDETAMPPQQTLEEERSMSKAFSPLITSSPFTIEQHTFVHTSSFRKQY